MNLDRCQTQQLKDLDLDSDDDLVLKYKEGNVEKDFKVDLTQAISYNLNIDIEN